MTQLLFSREGAFAPDLRAHTEHKLSLDIYEERGGVLPRAWPQPAVHEIASTAIVEGAAWKVTTVSAVHAQPQLQCYAYRLDCDEGSFVYSGDSGPSRRITELARGCDVLVHMCAYESGTQLSDVHAKTCCGHRGLALIAAEAQVKILVLSHFNTKMTEPANRARILTEMSALYPGRILWGEDLMTIPVSRAGG